MASTPEREQLRLLLVEDNPGDARLLTETVYAEVTEAVETRAQRDEVEAIGCRLGQGFFLGRPMPAADLGELLSL